MLEQIEDKIDVDADDYDIDDDDYDGAMMDLQFFCLNRLKTGRSCR